MKSVAMQVHCGSAEAKAVRALHERLHQRPAPQSIFNSLERHTRLPAGCWRIPPGEVIEQLTQRLPERFHRALARRPQSRFQLGKDLLNGVRIRAVRGQWLEDCPPDHRLGSRVHADHWNTLSATKLMLRVRQAMKSESSGGVFSSFTFAVSIFRDFSIAHILSFVASEGFRKRCANGIISESGATFNKVS